MTYQEIIKIAEAAEENGFSCFGLRQHHASVKVEEELSCSYNTIDDEEPEELNGTCAIEFIIDEGDDEIEWCIEKLKECNYQDGEIILIGGDNFEYGNDEGEVIIEDAKVLAIIS